MFTNVWTVKFRLNKWNFVVPLILAVLRNPCNSMTTSFRHVKIGYVHGVKKGKNRKE